MKKFLKFVIGIAILGSLGVVFLPLVRVAGLVEFSISELLAAAGGKTVEMDYDDLKSVALNNLAEISERYHEELSPYLLMAGIFLVVIVAAAALTMTLAPKIAYYISLLAAAVVGCCTVYLFVQVKSGLDEIESALGLGSYRMVEVIQFETLTLTLWCLVWLLVLVLSAYGIMTVRRERPIRTGVIPDFPPMAPVVPPVTLGPGTMKTYYESFQGAVVSRNSFYGKRVYPLQERMEVFFAEENGVVYITKFPGANILAGVYFVKDYQEYCIDVYEPRSVYLVSGQPLGPNRRYYLPRGMEIYLKEQRFLFKLA